ncbi:MAG: hypothetical protein WAK18_18025, partial [Nocardioidaceae bacterium]
TEQGPPRVIVVGAAATAGDWNGDAGGDLQAFGCDVSFGGPEILLPLSLTIGAYLLDEAGWPASGRRYVAVAGETVPSTSAQLGRALVGSPEPVAVLAMADGSARRTTASPGYLDERAIGYDEAVVTALAQGDVERLLALDPDLDAALWSTGRPVWQVLAGAAQATYEAGGSIGATVLYDAAPYGVGYAVVEWALTYTVT